jgi:hypothetical protein
LLADKHPSSVSTYKEDGIQDLEKEIDHLADVLKKKRFELDSRKKVEEGKQGWKTIGESQSSAVENPAAKMESVDGGNKQVRPSPRRFNGLRLCNTGQSFLGFPGPRGDPLPPHLFSSASSSAVSSADKTPHDTFSPSSNVPAFSHYRPEPPLFGACTELEVVAYLEHLEATIAAKDAENAIIRQRLQRVEEDWDEALLERALVEDEVEEVRGRTAAKVRRIEERYGKKLVAKEKEVEEIKSRLGGRIAGNGGATMEGMNDGTLSCLPFSSSSSFLCFTAFPSFSDAGRQHLSRSLSLQHQLPLFLRSPPDALLLRRQQYALFDRPLKQRFASAWRGELVCDGV